MHKRKLQEDVKLWETKYSELMTTPRTMEIGGSERRNLGELDGTSCLPPQLEGGWRPGEIDGTQVRIGQVDEERKGVGSG